MNEIQTIAADESYLIGRVNGIKLHGPEGFAGMRAAGRLAAQILDALVPHVVPGVTTDEIDAIVHRMTLDGGAVPATLGYRGLRAAAAHRSTMSYATAFPATAP